MEEERTAAFAEAKRIMIEKDASTMAKAEARRLHKDLIAAVAAAQAERSKLEKKVEMMSFFNKAAAEYEDIRLEIERNKDEYQTSNTTAEANRMIVDEKVAIYA